jgi:transposase InsO family protein
MMLASESGIPIARACDVLGVSRATHYRTSSPRPEARSAGPRRPSPRRLSDIERAALLDVLHSPEFVDQPPAEIYASLLSRGEYLGSVRTMYRLLAEHGETQERRRQRRPHQHPIPTLSATAPNQVWTWDITKLRGPAPGIFYALYVIIDLFSRMVVGWLLAGKESGELAKQLFAEAYARHDVKPGSLVVHSDRGAAMRSEGLAQLFGKLGVERSFSRPRVSDDNAFSEAHFKTLKYQPDYPDRFSSDLHARGWGEEFFGWYNERHHHVGLALFTPPGTSDRGDNYPDTGGPRQDASRLRDRTRARSSRPARLLHRHVRARAAAPRGQARPSSRKGARAPRRLRRGHSRRHRLRPAESR